MADNDFIGFLPVSRKFFKNFLWQEERTYSRAEAWLDLVQASAYEPQKHLVAGELVEVPRGGIVASERFLCDRWKWSRTKVRAFLDLLVKEGMISPQKNHRNTVFLLSNFGKYNQQKNHQSDRRETSERPPGNQIEESKEGEKGEGHPPTASSIPSLPAALAGITDVLKACPEFVQAWQNWSSHLDEIGKPLSRQQKIAVLTECGRAGAIRAAEVLRYSVTKGAKNPIWDAPKTIAPTTPKKKPKIDPAAWAEWGKQFATPPALEGASDRLIERFFKDTNQPK